MSQKHSLYTQICAKIGYKLFFITFNDQRYSGIDEIYKEGIVTI
jgi:hypothetical protein